MKQQAITLVGTVQKLIDRSMSMQPQQVQIRIHLHEADHLYDELRIPNILGWEEGKPVEVTIRLLAAESTRAA
jgi:hypothetical protein